MAVTAYVALLAAAVGTRALIFMDLVWCVTLLAVCYAIIVGCIERGRRQAMAIGFVVLACAHMLVSRLHPESTPATWVYNGFGYYADTGVVYERTDMGGGGNRYVSPRWRQVNGFVPHPRVANAVVTLAAGLIGCWIGALAYKHRSDGNAVM